MAVNVVLNLLLIKPLGINGAAIATAASLEIRKFSKKLRSWLKGFYVVNREENIWV
jgi:O-antigen/teichoic acid export membrane protein